MAKAVVFLMMMKKMTAKQTIKSPAIRIFLKLLTLYFKSKFVKIREICVKIKITLLKLMLYLEQIKIIMYFCTVLKSTTSILYEWSRKIKKK
jgi:hypothetical protein